jgi:hypothetical protein
MGLIIIGCLEIIIVIIGIVAFIFENNKVYLWSIPIAILLGITTHTYPTPSLLGNLPTDIILIVGGIFTWIITHRLILGIGIAIYLVLGAIWSIVKWWFYLHDELERVQENSKYDIAILEKLNNAPSGLEERNRILSSVKSRVPKASENKTTITNWMIFWPFSMLYSLYADILCKLFNRIYQALQRVYDKITASVFRDIINLK